MNYRSIIESPYGRDPNNFHVAKQGNELHVTLTYPPRTEAENPEQARYVVVNQESVRASDGVRLHYDYGRDGFVVEQNRMTVHKVEPGIYEIVDGWVEAGFFMSWPFGDVDSEENIDKADAEYEKHEP